MRHRTNLPARIRSMIARMLLVLLLVLNLGAAAWWALHRPAPAPAAAPLDASVPTLELMRTQDITPIANTAASISEPATPDIAPAISEPVAPVAAPLATVCASFGPFADEAAVQTARGRLAGPGVQANVRSIGNANARGYNVYLPPLANRDAAVAMVERLRAAGFNDLLLRNDGEAANSIALGRFGAEANARSHQAALQAKGFAAQVAPIGGGVASYWLDVSAPTGFDPNAQRTRLGANQVQLRDCPV